MEASRHIALKWIPASHSIEARTMDPELSHNWSNTGTTVIAVAAEVEELVGRTVRV